jgi:hypothetical protein
LEPRASVKRFVWLHFLNLKPSVGTLGRGISPFQSRYLTQTQNKHKQTSIPWIGFEPTIPVFKWTKTFHSLDLAVTVIGIFSCSLLKYSASILSMVGLLMFLMSISLLIFCLLE